MALSSAQPRGTEARLMKDGDRLERERKRLEDRLLRERQKVRGPGLSGAPRPRRAPGAPTAPSRCADRAWHTRCRPLRQGAQAGMQARRAPRLLLPRAQASEGLR